ncbi:MAG: ferritin family protein [Desulfobacterales bacterium]|nr:ferritin family protein [Desulfobacterales bacterium]
MYTIDEVYGLAIQIEKNGENFYREGLKKISSPQVKALLERLADDEKKHIETFTQMKEALKQNPALPDEPPNAVLLNILGDQSFSLKETDLAAIDSEELIQAALEFEKDTILFF